MPDLFAALGPKRIVQRDYQKEGMTLAQEAYNKGITRQLHEWATGLGKTAGFAAELPEGFDDLTVRRGDEGGLIFFSHRREIIRQSRASFEARWPDRWIGVEMGEEHATGDEDFIFCSVDSLGRLMSNRIIKYGHRRPAVVVFDEAHHLTMDGTWDNLATFFGVGSDPSTRFRLKGGRHVLSILLTATPDRHDKQSLAPFADEIVSRYNYRYGVDNGWLCDILAYYTEGVGAARPLDLLMKALIEYGQGHRSLVFAPSVADSAELAATLNERGLAKAAHVDALTEGVQRNRAITDFRKGRLDVLSNYAVFTEGTDVPAVTMVLDGMATKSRPLHAQKIGRGSRTHPDAQVDSYATARERLDAIAASPKPYLLYVATFDPTVHGLTVYSTLTGDERPLVASGKKLTEVIDTIEYFDEAMPEVPTADIRTLEDIELISREVNVWTRTIYNERLRALSPLSWVAVGETLALHVPMNPWAHPKKPAEHVPAVVSFTPVREDGRLTHYEKTITLAGGWNARLKAPLRKRVLSTERVPAKEIQTEVRAIDTTIQKRKPLHYERLVRRPHGKPEPEQVRYLKNAGIKYDGESLTAGTADLLIADHRVRKALDIT